MRERTSGGRLKLRLVVSGGVEQRRRRRGLERQLELADRRKIVEVVRSDGAAGQLVDLHHPLRPGDLAVDGAFDQANERLTAAELSGKLLLRLSGHSFAPFRQPHAASPKTHPRAFNCNLQYKLARYKRMGAAEYNGTSCSLFFMKPGNRLRELRREAKLTQAELAAITGVSQPAISQIESGTRSMDVAWMRTFARALGCAPADLLDRQDNPDALDDHERQLIERYRSAEPSQRETLDRVAAAVVPLKQDDEAHEQAA